MNHHRDPRHPGTEPSADHGNGPDADVPGRPVPETLFPGPAGSIIDPELARKLDPPRARPPLTRQLISFVLVGVVSAVVDFGLLVILMALGLGHTLAKALSWVAGTITAYLLNRRFTFRATGSTRRFVAVLALYLITFAVQVGLFAVLYPWLLGLTNRPIAQIVGFVIAQGVATVTNFVVQRTVIFGKP